MSAGAYQRLLRNKRRTLLPSIYGRANILRREVRILTINKIIYEVNMMIYEMEHIARSNHL